MRLKSFVVILVLLFAAAGKSSAQIYAKLNAPYAFVGVINPSFEFTLSEKSTFQTDIVISPWNSIEWKGIGRPMKFLLFTNEYRRYFKRHNSGWYVGADAGIMTFHMAKPEFNNGKLGLQDVASKGYGFLLGVSGGYELKLGEKWIMDAFVGFGWLGSMHNVYALKDGIVQGGRIYNKGELIVTPGNGDWGDKREDSWNGSGEWLPFKIGVSFGAVIFDPNKRKNLGGR